jgi:predicted AAA+ superfamily ATPase
VDAGTIAGADFAADLAKVIRGIASEDYQKPDRSFANIFPTQGLQNLLRNGMGRLTGDSTGAAAICRLDTSYGGGKTFAGRMPAPPFFRLETSYGGGKTHGLKLPRQLTTCAR